MKVDRMQFLQAARSFSGWIDRRSGYVIRRGWMGNPDVLCSLQNGEIVLLETEEIRECSLLEIPRLCPGHVELVFLQRHGGALPALIEAYGLDIYIKESLPVFLGPDTDESILQIGRKIWNRTLRMREENDFAEKLFEEDAIEDTILQKWCAENGVELIGPSE